MASNDLLEELQLNDYYPQKLSFTEAIKLRGESGNGLQELHGLEIIRKLLMFDSMAVDSVTSEINKQLNSADATGQYDSDGVKSTTGSKFRPSWMSGIAVQSERKLHPMDLLVVVMNCCDDFLRQVLVEKMFTNKLSIPILIPSLRNGSYTLLFSALKSLVPEVQVQIEERSDSLSDTLVDVKQPIVSFIRVGELHRSKSKLINELLGFNVFNTFFHRECQNGSAKRTLSNGCIEAAWFQSETVTEEEFNCKLFTAMNLRGDARHYSKQTQFLCQTSTLVVFLVESFESFQDLYDKVLKDTDKPKAKFIICHILSACPDTVDDSYFKFLEHLSDCGLISEVKYDWLGDTKKMSDTELVKELKIGVSQIFVKEKRHLMQVQTYATLSLSGKDFGFLRDEGKLEYEMSENANKLVELILKESPNCKPKILPLQGEPWKKIGKLEREQHGKSQNINQVEYFIAEKETEKRQQREIQRRSLCQENNAIHTFCLCLIFQEHHDISYYLNSVKIKLDAQSRVRVASFVENVNKCVQLSVEEEREVKLKKLELDITNNTIGLEHILREIGQIYEAVLSGKNCLKEELNNSRLTPDVICNFPAAIAGLLLMGQPLELMDGDASNVPVTWVKAVLNQISIITNNAKIFVLSIIGIQSSGKSTLLNALFGLQFPVSAGRCTRGIYCHLVPIDKERFCVENEYVLVLDTEGLRSSESLDNSTFRDNELATFAIGLADATIINMKGENWSEMKDILQIVAHGLIRVRKTKAELKLMPRCMFVHQNVPAADAKDKNRVGQENQFLYLDKAIKAAARKEGFKEITKFDQVIAYDSDSWYFPDLWNGKPPRAKISQDYIRKVNELRQYLMQLMISTPSKLTVSSFILRMSDLWNAMLHNDFVLCFRNTQEILSGTVLNDRISRYVDEFKNQNRNVQMKYRELICSILNIKELDKEKMLRQASEGVTENFTKMMAILKDVIDATDICSGLKKKYDSSLIEIRDEELRHIKDEAVYDVSVQVRKVEISNDQNVKQLIERMLRLEKCTDEMEKVEFNETGMKNFEVRWERLIAENEIVIDNRRKMAQVTIQNEILKSALAVLQSLEIKSFTAAEIVKTPFSHVDILQASERDIVSIEDTDVLGFVWPKSPDVNMVNNRFCAIINSWNFKFQNNSSHDFDSPHWQQVMSEVGQILGIRGSTDDKCSILPPGYKFSEDYKTKLLHFVFNYLYNRCLENSTRFISMTDPLADISDRQRKSLSSYRMLLAEINIDVVCETIFDCAKDCLVRKLGELIKAQVIKEENRNPNFKTKRDFLKRILTDLGKRKHNFTSGNKEKKDIFKDFMLYIEMAESKKSEDFFLDGICKLLKEMLAIDDSALETDFQKMVKNYVGNFVEKAKAALKQAETKCNGSTMEYVRIFTKEMNMTDEICLRVNTLSGFTKAVLDKIDILYGDFLTQANSLFETIACKGDRAALRPLFEKIMGCRERCPFCSAPCSQSLQGHPEDHRANHYPMGVGGTVDIWHLFANTKETKNAAKEERKLEKLSLDTCQSVVGSRADMRTKATVHKYTKWYHKLLKLNYHSFKSYKELAEYIKWDIPHSRHHKTSLYWKWFVAQFAEELAEHYKAKCPDIPEAWTHVTWKEAKESLKEPDYCYSNSTVCLKDPVVWEKHFVFYYIC